MRTPRVPTLIDPKKHCPIPMRRLLRAHDRAKHHIINIPRASLSECVRRACVRVSLALAGQVHDVFDLWVRFFQHHANFSAAIVLTTSSTTACLKHFTLRICWTRLLICLFSARPFFSCVAIENSFCKNLLVIKRIGAFARVAHGTRTSLYARIFSKCR